MLNYQLSIIHESISGQCLNELNIEYCSLSITTLGSL